MTERQTFDLVVVGGGSGGYAAARTARELGASVAIVDHGPLGGLCILRGCMPSKTLLASADSAQRIREAGAFGVEVAAPTPNLPHVIERKRRLIGEFTAYRREQLETFPIFAGHARFVSDEVLAVGDGLEIAAAHFVIATGSVIASPPFPSLNDIGYITSDDILDQSELPKSLIALGGGYVACELGQYLHRMGVKTEIILRAPRALSSEDADVGEALTEALRHEGLTLTTNAQIERFERTASGRKRVYYRQDGIEHSAEADEIGMFLGRVPNIAGLELETIGVKAHAMKGIEVDEFLRTTNPRVFAVGDVTGLFPLVHVAIAQGEIAAKNALREPATAIDYRLQKARTIFTEPQVAVAGETENELTKSGTAYLVAKYPFADHGKAQALERTAGFVKLLASPLDGRVLGAAVVGAEGSELIHEMLVALHFGATVSDIMRIPHLHPTLSEIWTYPAEELSEIIASQHLVIAQH